MVLQGFFNAFIECSPYTFDELVEKDLVNIVSNAPIGSHRVEYMQDDELKYDYDFSNSSEKNMRLDDDDDDVLNEKISAIRNRIKDIRIRQRYAYMEMRALLKQGSPNYKEKFYILRAEIDEGDDMIARYYKLCTDIENGEDGPFQELVRDDGSKLRVY